jgi:hypothetical protein
MVALCGCQRLRIPSRDSRFLRPDHFDLVELFTQSLSRVRISMQNFHITLQHYSTSVIHAEPVKGNMEESTWLPSSR